MIEVDGPPERWIVRGGRPADVAWQAHRGIPSYESDTGKILVYDLLVAHERAGAVPRHGFAAVARTTMFFPRGYAGVAARSVLVGDHELCALHDDPDAAWVWRPVIYELADGLTRRGSQEELEWRWSLHEMEEYRQDLADAEVAFILGQITQLRRRYGELPPIGDLPKNARKRLFREYQAEVDRLNGPPTEGLPFQEANRRADALLREHLNPQQLLDLAASGCFYVRGTINSLYAVRLGNGAAIVSPQTRKVWVSLCLHPERWIPHADVALATKLAIESGPEGEEEMLAGARSTAYGQGRGSTAGERAAWERERHLLPSPVASPEVA